MGVCSSSSSSYEEKPTVGMSKKALVRMLPTSHFTPATFPIIPIVSAYTGVICESSWKDILNSSEVTEFGTVTAGVTLFYNEFYERLAKVDRNGKFEAVLSKAASNAGQSKIAAKGAIITRIVKFVIGVANNISGSQKAIYMLGKAHVSRNIRPWQYSIFLETLLQTIASRLKTGATNDVMSAWVHIFAFILKIMLPPAIADSVDRRELYVGTATVNNLANSNSSVSEVDDYASIKKKVDNADCHSETHSVIAESKIVPELSSSKS